MKKLFKLLKFWSILISLTILGVVIGFSAENTQSIQLSFLDYKTFPLPIFAWLVISFVCGITLTLTALLPLFIRIKRPLSKK